MESGFVIEVIRQDPTSVKWKKSHKLDLQRNENKELGVMINTFQGSSDGKRAKETFTVITKVKEECALRNPEKLNVGDRILKICSKKIDKWDLDSIEKLLIKLKIDKKKSNCVPLEVCKLDTESLPHMTTSFCSTASCSRKPKKLSIASASNRSATHRRDSAHNGTLTPVEAIENMPFVGGAKGKGGGGAEAFTALEEVQDLDLVRVALSEPWRIIWQADIMAVKVKKSNGKIGVDYKFRVQECTKDSFCIVEKVNTQGPAHGLLRPGDLVHSVDSKAIVNQNTMRNAISHCSEDTVKLCIQRPEDIRGMSAMPAFSMFGSVSNKSIDDIKINITDNESRRTASGTKEKGKSNGSAVRTEKQRSVRSDKVKTSKATGTTPPREDSLKHKSVSNATLKNNLSKIPVKQSAISKIGIFATDDCVVSRVSGAVHMDSFRKGHRRNLSDSSSVYYKQQMPGTDSNCLRQRVGDMFTQYQNKSTRDDSTPFPSLSHLSCSLKRCLSKWTSTVFKKHTDHFPYVRFVHLNTSNAATVPTFKALNKLLQIEKGLEQLKSSHQMSFGGKYVVSTNGIKPVSDILKQYTIEEIILSRSGAAFLKELKYVLDNRTVCLKQLTSSASQQEQLIGQFLDDPPDVETHFIGIESMLLKFSEVCRTEYNVMFSENSIFFVTIDISQCKDPRSFEIELGRIQVCVNNIKMLCKNAHVCFVIDSKDADPLVEGGLGDRLSELYVTKRICGCGHGTLQVIQNNRTTLPLFNLAMHSVELKAALLQSVNDVVHGGAPGMGKKFPLLALKLNQLLEKQKSMSPVVTQTQILEMLHEICPNLRHMDSVMNHALCSLHTAGKVINPSQLHHAAANEHHLPIFILHRPHTLIQCMRELRALSPSGLITKEEFMRPKKSAMLLTDCSLYLLLFHCIEKVNNEYRFVPDANFHYENNVLEARNGAPMYRYDFDGFLPIAMVNYLFCALAQQFQTSFVLEGGGLRAVYEIPAIHTRTVLSLNPYQSMGTLRFQGPGGASLSETLLRVKPEWLTVYPDSGSGAFAGFHNSCASLQVQGLETPIKNLPRDLLQVINDCLLPGSSALGKDVRMLADILLKRTLTQQDCLTPDLTLLVLGDFVTTRPTVTLCWILRVLSEDMQRKDVALLVGEWIRDNVHGTNIR